MKSISPTIASIILAILYSVGIIGILLPIHDDFVLLTPLNLLFSLGLTLYFHPEWTKEFSIFIAIAFFTGLGIEILGVQTGLVFGDYQYGRVLGWKIFETPLMIGVNWILVSYCAAISAHHLLPNIHTFLKSMLAAGILVFLDVLIEPVAVHYDFWSWENNSVPIQNYIAWFVIAFGLIFIFYQLVGFTKNRVAVVLLLLQFLFFGILNFTS